MIRSEFFYENLWKSILLKPHIKFIEDDVHSFFETEDGVKVVTAKSTYLGCKILNSIPDKNSYGNQKRYPVLQHPFF